MPSRMDQIEKLTDGGETLSRCSDCLKNWQRLRKLLSPNQPLVSLLEVVLRLGAELSTSTRQHILGLTIGRALAVREPVILVRKTEPPFCRQLQLLCGLNVLLAADRPPISLNNCSDS